MTRDRSSETFAEFEARMERLYRRWRAGAPKSVGMAYGWWGASRRSFISLLVQTGRWEIVSTRSGTMTLPGARPVRVPRQHWLRKK